MGPMLEQFAPDGWTPWFRPISGAVEELLPVGSPRRISSGGTVSREREPMLEKGQRVTEKDQQQQSVIE